MVKQALRGDELVTLVDSDDNVVGAAEKLQAHREGALHRAFSVFVFDAGGRLLLQRRSAAKYHSAGLWSNTCCGHPRPGEALERAASRRLVEEMGFGCELRQVFQIHYRAELAGAMIEHEIDHVFVGRFAGVPKPDPWEIDGVAWVPLDELRREIAGAPHDYTAWLKMLLECGRWTTVEQFLAEAPGTCRG